MASGAVKSLRRGPAKALNRWGKQLLAALCLCSSAGSMGCLAALSCKGAGVQYRSEIDGLRAVAVVPVILFHAGFSAFSGGYVGVDVFFVISGYLITSIIINQLAEGRFRLLTFYERRARRILPALFLVIACCIPFAMMWLPPLELKDFFQSIGASSVFASNILFWSESGYFNTANELKPLLHTWSLAVEEQYYILFPLFLMLFWRWGRTLVLALLAIGFVISLGLAHWAADSAPTANFFLLPTRGWEILMGAFAAFYLARSARAEVPLWLANVLSLSGLGLIGVAVFLFDDITPFPSLWALAPTLGTLLIILFANAETLVGKLLSLRLLVLMGLISYSAYLWHQPLLAFARHYTLSHLTLDWQISLIALTFVLAYFSWKYVETPFRTAGKISRTTILRASAAVLPIGLAIGAVGHFTIKEPTALIIGGDTLEIPTRFRGIMRDGRNCSFPENIKDDVCVFEGERLAGSRPVLVLGDSHARVLTAALQVRPDMYSEMVDLSASGCPFLMGIPVYNGRDTFGCTADYQAQRLDYIKANYGPETVIILTARWPLYFYGEGYDNTVGGVEIKPRYMAATEPYAPLDEIREKYFEGLDASIEELSAVTDKIVLILPTHTNGWRPPNRANRLAKRVSDKAQLFARLEIPMAPVLKRAEPFDDYAAGLKSQNPNISLIDPRQLTCDPAKGVCYGGGNGHFYFADEDHLAPYITAKLAELIAQELDG